ncbi:MAG: hypothetical protein ACREFM_23510 [Hypericibacter sp.]
MTIRQDFQRAMDSEIAALAAFPTPTLPEAIGQRGTMPMAIKRSSCRMPPRSTSWGYGRFWELQARHG